jgi:phosphoenolpyruvate---glycerone phosphotransferase subunit DhaL
MSTIPAKRFISWIERYAGHIADQKDYLTALDSAIGDADHGVNMHRGLQAVLAKKTDLENKDLGALFKIVAMTLIQNIGGASGALYGTFFLQASSAAGAKNELSPTELGTLLEKGLAGIGVRFQWITVINPFSERNPEQPFHNPLRPSSSRLRRCAALAP